MHLRVKGVDEVTRRPYDAIDPDRLLRGRACLVDSALLFEAVTVGALDEAGRQRFHEEEMLDAELLLLPRDRIGPRGPELRAYIDEVVGTRIFRVTDAARRVAELLRRPPPGAEWRPVLRLVSRWAFGTLPPALREAHGVRGNAARELGLRATLLLLRAVRPFLPPRYRFIAPCNAWRSGERAAVALRP